MNLILNLVKNQYKADIDDTFIKAVEAILYIDPTQNCPDLGKPFQFVNSSKAYSFNQSDPSNDGSLADFLFSQLLSNMRRLYAVTHADKKKTKQSIGQLLARSGQANQPHNNTQQNELDRLIKQQDNIFKLFKLFEPNIDYSAKINHKAPKLLNTLNHESYFTPIDCACYIALHESLQHQHVSKIKEIIQKTKEDKYEFSQMFISFLSILTPPKDMNEDYTDIVKHALVNHTNKVVQALIVPHPHIKSKFVSTVFNCLPNLQPSLFTPELYDALFRAFNATELYKSREYKENSSIFSQILAKANKEIISATVSSSSIIDKDKANNNDFLDFAFLDPAVKDSIVSNTILQILKASTCSSHLRKKAANSIDLKNPQVFGYFIKNLNKQQIESLIKDVGLGLDRQQLAQILSVNHNYLPLVQPYYEKIRISDTLLETNTSNSPQPESNGRKGSMKI